MGKMSLHRKGLQIIFKCPISTKMCMSEEELKVIFFCPRGVFHIIFSFGLLCVLTPFSCNSALIYFLKIGVASAILS